MYGGAIVVGFKFFLNGEQLNLFGLEGPSGLGKFRVNGQSLS